jgi:hypothetical protein
VRRVVRGVIISLLVGVILAVPSAAWASGAQTAGAVTVSGQALEQELQQAIGQGLSEAEASRLAYELRGVKDPFVKPSFWTAPSFNSAQLARAEAARSSLKLHYAVELELARGSLLRSLRGFSDLVFQARTRGIELGDFAQQVDQYRAYAGQAATIVEFRDLSTFLAPKAEQVRQLVAEFNRESEAANAALGDARATLAEARALPNLQLDAYAGAIDSLAGALARAGTVISSTCGPAPSERWNRPRPPCGARRRLRSTPRKRWRSLPRSGHGWPRLVLTTRSPTSRDVSGRNGGRWKTLSGWHLCRRARHQAPASSSTSR